MQTPVVIGLVGGLVALVLVVVVIYFLLGSGSVSGSKACPTTINRELNGSLVLKPTGKIFQDMNAFQQWWNSSGLLRSCPLPILTGAREVDILVTPDRPMRGPEETYAKTPINKVDDYEFGRIFGIERGAEMVIPRQNFNKIVSDRAFDNVNKPITAEGRKDSYRGVVEGFTAMGDLTSKAEESYGSSDSSREATARYGEIILDEPDKDCKISREERKIAKMVSKAYADDPNFDPVVVKVGPNNWEVTELIPKRRGEPTEVIVEEEILDPKREAVDIQFRYPGENGYDRKDMIDPFFPPAGQWNRRREERDPYYGYVPGLERPFGPTFDHFSWT